MISANQEYKLSGSTLPFAQWLEREKTKGRFIPNKGATEEFMNFAGAEKYPSPDGSEPIPAANYVVPNLLRTAALIGVVYIVYRVYKNAQK